MNILRNIEKSFIGHIENKSNPDALKKLIHSYFDKKKENDDILNQKYNKYVALYENERINNNLEYNAYLNERAILYDVWKKDKSKANLIDLVKMPRPELKEVADIYTHSIISLREEKPKVPFKPDKPVKPVKVAKEEKAKEEKKCPEGKILNEKTGRCINDPNYKKAKKA